VRGESVVVGRGRVRGNGVRGDRVEERGRVKERVVGRDVVR
jgi:hypothetical protein